jgi:hypothetical protein
VCWSRRAEERARSRRPRRVIHGAIIAVAAAAVLAGCASGTLESVRSLGSVTRLPPVVALEGQSPSDREWDVKDCKAEAGYATHYSPTDSPLGNFFQKLFFWGTAGAALGGTIDGFPAIVGESTASTGLLAGASAGGATGVALSVSGQSRYERAWAACVRARGYAIDTEAMPSTPR